MGLYDFWWNISQSSEIDELKQEIESLRSRIHIAEGWILYLDNELKKVHNEQSIENARANENGSGNS